MRRPATYSTYSYLDELFASTTEPLAEDKRTYQLTRMWQGLAALERAEQPANDDWRVCSDAVNLMETLIEMGQLQDDHGLLHDALSALARAGQRHQAKGVAIRLDAPGIQAVRALLEDYAAAIGVLPARTMVQAHRRTEKRIRAILAGRGRAEDVEIMEL